MNLMRFKKITISVIACLGFLVSGFILERINQPIYPIVYFLAILVGGIRQTKEGVVDLVKHRELNVDLLMAFATIGACIIGHWFEGAMLTFIFCLSGQLEDYTFSKSNKELSKLMNAQAKTALLLTSDGTTCEQPVSKLRIGNSVLVPKGAMIPIDGKLLSTFTTIDESALTGESIPIEKKQDDELFAGTINLGNAITMFVTKREEDSLFSKIIQLVNDAQSTPSHTATFIDTLESIYVKAVFIGVPLLIASLYFLFDWSWNDSLYKGIVLFVVASPCALVASVTPATLSAISNGAKQGILFKGGIYLENLAELSALSFDKTGTLTNGIPVVTNAVFLTEKPLAINVLVAMEKQSTHPLARSIVNYFEKDVTKLIVPTHLNDITGLGIECYVQSDYWRIGKKEPSIIEEDSHSKEIEQLQKDGKTVIYLYRQNQLIAYFGLLDTPRPEAKQCIQYFQQRGIHTMMITGDNQKTAAYVAKQLGVDEVHANCLPEDKANLLKQQQKDYGMNAMVGDGINDAPALANASIGIAMGGGTDIAMDVADIILLQNDLERLKNSHILAKKLKKIVFQNIIFSTIVIFILIFCNFFNQIDLPLGVFFHEGSTILVILNGLRLLPINSKNSLANLKKKWTVSKQRQLFPSNSLPHKHFLNRK